MNLAQTLVPHNTQLGVLLLQLGQPGQHRVGVAALRQQQTTALHRLEHRGLTGGLLAQALACPGTGQAGNGAHGARRGLLHRLEFGSGIHPQLVGLFLPGLTVRIFTGEQCLYPQMAAGDLQPGESAALFVPGDFEHPGGKLFRLFGLAGILLQGGQQFIHTLQLQRRAEQAGKHLPPGHHGGDQLPGHFSVFQIGLHGLFALHGQCFRKGIRFERTVEGHETLFQAGKLIQHCLPIRSSQIHLVHKHKHRHPITAQQLPHGFGVALHAVGAAYHQHRVVQHRESALHLAGKIHMAGGIQQGDLRIGQAEHRLLGEDGDAPLPLHGVGIQKGVLVIHTAQLFQASGPIQQCFGQGGFTRVHMGQQTRTNSFHRVFSCDRTAFYCITECTKIRVSFCFFPLQRRRCCSDRRSSRLDTQAPA